MNYRSGRFYENLEKHIFRGVGQYGIPYIQATQFDFCEKWIGFHQVKGCTACQSTGVHFFLDDYQFERIWNRPGNYIPSLQRFRYVMAPDFSLYTDWPKAIQIYNHYRKHWIGAWLQEHGVTILPTIAWSDETSYDWCFDGEPEHSAVAISSVGTQSNERDKRRFLDGYREMKKRLEPTSILFYGMIPEKIKDEKVSLIPAFMTQRSAWMKGREG